MRRPRLTIERLMVLVGVLAVALESVMLVRQSNKYGREAEECERQARLVRPRAEAEPSDVFAIERVARHREIASRYDHDARRYRAAQSRPRLGLPDGPVD